MAIDLEKIIMECFLKPVGKQIAEKSVVAGKQLFKKGIPALNNGIKILNEKVKNAIEPRTANTINKLVAKTKFDDDTKVIVAYKMNQLLEDGVLDSELSLPSKHRLFNTELIKLFENSGYKPKFNEVTELDLDVLKMIGDGIKWWIKNVLHSKGNLANSYFVPTLILLAPSKFELSDASNNNDQARLNKIEFIGNTVDISNINLRYNKILDNIFKLSSLNLLNCENRSANSSLKYKYESKFTKLKNIKPFSLSLTNTGIDIYNIITDANSDN